MGHMLAPHCPLSTWSGSLPSRSWNPHSHLADIQELIQGHALVQVQSFPQGSILLALPAGWGHGVENRASEDHSLPGAYPHLGR